MSKLKKQIVIKRHLNLFLYCTTLYIVICLQKRTRNLSARNECHLVTTLLLIRPDISRRHRRFPVLTTRSNYLRKTISVYCTRCKECLTAKSLYLLHQHNWLCWPLYKTTSSSNSDSNNRQNPRIETINEYFWALLVSSIDQQIPSLRAQHHTHRNPVEQKFEKISANALLCFTSAQAEGTGWRDERQDILLPSWILTLP